MLAFKSRLKNGVVRADGIELHVRAPNRYSPVGGEQRRSAGAEPRARIKGYPAELAPPELYAKGNYYTLAGGSPFSRLIYPVPEPGGLGVHVTLDLGGRARFGPDVEWVDRIDYSVDPRRAERFYAAIRRYWPDSRMGRWGRTTGHPPQDLGERRTRGGLPRARLAAARCTGLGAPLRHRIARAHRFAAARGCGDRTTTQQ